MSVKKFFLSAGLAGLVFLPMQASAEFGLLKGLTDLATGNTDAQQTATDGQPADAPSLKPGEVLERSVVYEGYSKKILPVKAMVSQGKLGEAKAELTKISPKPKKYDLLHNLQFGMLALDSNELKEAEERFYQAERKIVARNDQGKMTGLFSSAGKSVFSTITGNAELGAYPGVGFERVLMLNYKSIGYLLAGERKAYNVTRRAIDLQNIEKKAFDASIREAKEEIRKKESDDKNKGAELKKVGFGKIVKDQYKEGEKKAQRVPSAFVNPFGFYMAGIVQEFDSYEDVSLRDNARISYQKALELNPKSSVIKLAIKETKKPPRRDKRLVHVIVGDGFSPEKKLLKFDLAMGFGPPTVIELPVYESVPSKVHRVEVQTTKGARWGRLSEVANIDALAMRFQKDVGPLMQLQMMTTVIRNVIEGQAWSEAEKQAGVLGSAVSIFKKKRDEMAHPDMRSWSLLPARLLATRFYVPKSVSRVVLVSYDKKGKELNRQLVNIDKNSHNIIYARTLDNTMLTATNKRLWVGAR